ncbi:hypothetical protein BJX76DRAFT_354543 [Aspergillus varians]
MQTEHEFARNHPINARQKTWASSRGSKIDMRLELPQKDALKQDPSTTEGETVVLIAEKLPTPTSDDNEETALLKEVAAMCHCSPDDLDDVYPCTALQEGMMALTFKDSTAYTVKYEYTIPPNIDLMQLQGAWEQTAQANPVLRTRIVPTARRGCMQAVIRGDLVWDIHSGNEDDDEVPRFTENVLWKAGEPLAYFTLSLARRALTIVIHHSICDDWSMALLLRETDKAYNGETLAKHPFRPLVDYVQEAQPQAEEYWKDKFQDVENTSMSSYPPLPSVGYTPNPSEHRERTWVVNPGVRGAFTVNTKMRLAWAVLQSFYVDSRDVLFGAINVGRGVSVPGIEEISGPALTSVPVRAQLRMQDTVAEALMAVQQDWAAGMPYEHVGLQKLLHLGPGPEVACGFQTLLAVEPRNAHQIPRLFANHEVVQRNYDLYSLILRCRPSNTHMQVEAWFDPAVIEPRQTERLLGQLAHIYDQVERLPAVSLGDLDPVCPGDYESLVQWNAPVASTVPSDSCVHTLIEQRARVQGDALAIRSWDGDLSYQDLESMASSLAAHLSIDLVRPGRFVPLYLQKSKWTAVAMLAIMKAGAAFVLLDPSYPVSRLQRMCETVQASLVITCKELSEKATNLGTPTTFLVDDFDFETRVRRNSTSLPNVNPDSLIYATFTSGSTGTPKGVVVRHKGYAASATAHGPPYNFQPGARVLQFASPAFDSCIIEHLSTLIMGGSVCIPTQSDCHSRLAAAISQFQVNIACLTPSVARIVSPESVPALETLVFVGEKVLPGDVARWAPHAQVRNAYGPAECSAVFSVQPSLPQEDPANIGFPTGGVGWVVDPGDCERLMPLGSTGELLIEGPIVGAGYIGNPMQTQQVFVDAPRWRRRLGPIQHGTLYKTGDLVQSIPDGSFRYIGRKDNQVKLHGQRLELADIEYHLQKAFPGAEQVVVEMLRSGLDAPTQNRPDAVLVGFVAGSTPAHEQEPDSIFIAPSDDFRAACGKAESRLFEALPAFMVPAVFLPVSTMPLTPSGKMDRRHLRDHALLLSWERMQAYRTVTDVQIQQPASVQEEKLREIWAQTLNRPPDGICVADSFFRLGGDSVSAMQAATGCLVAGWNVTVADIFRYPSVRKLAQKVQELGRMNSSFSADPREDPTDVSFELSPMQQLFFEHASTGNSRFTQQFLLRLTRPVSIDRVLKAAGTVVERHSMLRARFRRQGNGQWEQFISPDVGGSVIIREHWMASSDTYSGLRRILGDSQGTLDVEQGPLLAIDLVHEEGELDLLGFMAHHLVIDLVSWRILLQDFEDILSSGRPLQPPSISFQQWCRMQEEYATKHINPQTALARAIPSAPVDYWGSDIGQNTWSQVIQHTICVSQEATQAILGPVNDALKTKPVEILQASLLHSFVNAFPDRACPTVFTEAHGREPWDPHINISRTVGWFTTMAPLVVDANAGQDIAETLRLTKDSRRAIPGNGWPYFTSRYYHPDGKKNCAQDGPMEILFNYTGLFQQLERPDALLQLACAPDHDLVPIPTDLPRFSLIDVSATVLNGSLSITFMHNEQMQHQDRLREWPRIFQRTLEEIPGALTQQQRLTLSDLPLLSLQTDQQLQDVLQEVAQKCHTEQANIENIYPCTPTQLGMWLGQLKVADMYWSQIQWAVQSSRESSVPVNAEQVRKAWQQVVNRHSILRTVILDHAGGYENPVQVVLKSVAAHIRIVSDNAMAAGIDSGTRQYTQEPTKPAHQLLISAQQDGSVSCELTIHHTLVDGVSTQIFLNDFCDAYNGLLDDTPAAPYSSYVEYLLRHPQDNADAYWTEYLNGLQPCMFPSLAAQEQSHKPTTLHSIPLNFGPTSSLLPLCQNQGITVSSVLRVAWGLALRAYTGSESVSFGYLTSGRDIPLHGASTIAGPLINLLVCRLSLPGDLSILDILQASQEDHGRSIENQHWSMARVMHSLGLSGQPMFNTAMSLQQPSPDPKQNETHTATVAAEGGHDSTEYNITVNVTIDNDKIHGDLTYWTKTLGDEQAELIADTLQQFVRQLLNPEHESLNHLDALGTQNKSQILEWNRHVPDPLQMCVHSGIQIQSLGRPDALAVSAWDGELTYGELEQIASSWARTLFENGVKPEVFVPICSGKSRWTVVAALAILKAGGAFMLLDPSHPAERLRDMVQQNFKCPFIIASAEYGALAASIVSKTLVIEDLVQWLPEDTPANTFQSPSISPKSAAYATFTSGTTGKPKASVIEHESFCSSAAAHSQALHINENSRVLQFASFAFDASIVEILTTLLSGGCICVVSQDDKERRLETTIQEHKVNWTLLTPSVARILTPKNVPSLKTLVLGGEAMTTEDVRRWSPYVELMNAYGPSECSVIATTQPSLEALSFQTANIGRGTGCVTWVVDPHDPTRSVPVGAPGEMLIEGAIIGRGYVNRPEQQRASFLAYPTWLEHDLVRYLPDGSLRYLGRKDRQVKLHGQRIELLEVEQHVLRCFPGPCDEVFAVLATLEGAGSEYLVAMVVDKDQREDDGSFDNAVQETERRLKEDVPSFLIPSAILPLREVPRQVNGKVNRDRISGEATAALRSKLEKAHQARETWLPADLTAEEHLLQGLWSRVLDCPAEKVGPNDNFFQLGGDSIAAMKLASAACSAGLNLTVPELFMSPKLGDLAQLLSASNERKKDPVVAEFVPLSLIAEEHHAAVREQAISQCGITEEDIEDILPCTALQSGLAVLTAERPGAYVAHHRLRLSEQIDLDRFKAAWENVAAINPILRTRIIETVDAQCLQVVVRNHGLNWTADEDVDEEVSQGLPFGKPLVHFKLIPVSDRVASQVGVVLTMHHAVYDAWSLQLLIQRAQLAYYDHPSSEIRTSPFHDFVQYTQSQMNAALEYWKGQFEDADADPFPALLAPSVRPRALQTKRCSLRPGPLHSSVTRSTAIRLAWALVQAQYQGKQDVVFGMVSSGRAAPVKGVEAISAPTIATVPLRVTIDPTTTVGKGLEKLQQNIAHMALFEQVGLHAIAALGPNSSRACSFQTLLNVEGQDELARMGSGLDIIEHVDTTAADGAFNTYALELTASLTPDLVTIDTAFDDSIISDWQVQRMLDQFAFLLEQVHIRPDASIQDVMTVNPRDFQQLQAWNADIPPLIETTVAKVIEQHCISQPVSHAVCAWDGVLSYQELDRWSNALADTLEDHGVGREMFIPIYTDRSRWTVVAVMAVLKAGAAFVLLDTSNPLGRLHSVCAEIGAPIIITSESCQQVAQTLVDRVVVVGRGNISSNPPLSHREKHPGNNPHQALYAVFTSGSTGKPKGAVVENGAFVTMAIPYTRTMRIDCHSRVLHFASYAFDVSIIEILGTLFAGACVCILSESDRREGLADAVQALQPSHTILTPSLLRALTPGEIGPIRTIMLLGEAVRPSDVTQWAHRVHLMNTYGPAECTVVYTMQSAAGPPSTAPNIGHPIAGATWVTDPKNPNLPVPIGAVGELLLQGPLVGRGYLNRPEQTSAAFIPCPSWLKSIGLSSRPDGSKVYRTGDLVRYESDGSLWFVGRRDCQVKLRGQRFELGEVEEQVQQAFRGTLNDVVALIVTPIEGIQTPYLVVFIVPRHPENAIQPSPSPVPPLAVIDPPGYATTSAKSQRRLEDALPSYMLPSAIIPLAQMPRSVGGKLDRRQLREAVASIPRQRLEAFAPTHTKKRAATTEAETTLQRIWARVLGLQPNDVGTDDSFFRLGGDSISALQAVTQARSVGINHSVSDLFHWRTIVQVARRFATSPKHSIHRAPDIGSVLPCTPAQRGILLSQMRDKTSYTPHFVWKIRGGNPHESGAIVNVERLVTAWHQVVARHPALRTALQQDPSSDGQFEQIVFQQIQPRISLIQDVPAGDLEGDMPLELARLSPAVSQLDGETIPHQLTVCITDTGEIYARLDISHVVIDAMSITIIEGDLCQAYDSFLQPGTQSDAYQNYVIFSQSQSTGPASKYWQTYLENVEPCRLPSDSRQSDNNAADALEQLNLSLSNSASEIESFCHGTDWTASSLLYFAWAMTLRAFTRSNDICFGTLTSGRLVPVDGIEGAVGQFSNMSVCRIRMADVTVSEIAMCLQEDFSSVLAYQAFPLIEIARAAGVPMEDLTSTAINVQYEPSSTKGKKYSLSLTPVGGKDPVSQDVTLYILLQQDGTTRASMSYRPSNISPAFATQLAEYFDLAVSSLLQGRFNAIHDLELLTSRDQDRLHSWNSPLGASPESTVHELIEARAQELPDHPAVSGSDGNFSYKELNDLGTQIAASLRGRGVSNGQLIPLCFEKSRWVPVAIMAVLKAGGTIVPLDPAQPVSRLRDICKRVNATLVLSSPAQASLSRTLASDVVEIGDITGIHLEHEVKHNYATGRPDITSSQPVYVLFTSGTTGTPKGVMISHSSYCYAAETHIQAFELTRASRVLQISSYSFDVSMMEMLTTLIAGATICTITDSEKAQMLMDGACPFAVSHAYLTPSLAGALDPDKANWIDTLVLQGEPMAASYITQWGEKCRLIDAYGPTECAVINIATSPLVPGDDARWIGHGLGIHCWVVDPHDHNTLLPIGAVGELLLNGPAVGQGYLNDPKRTLEAFIEPPGWLRARYPDGGGHNRLYKTGDLVRYDTETGRLLFEGRKDRQIKVHGQRVELADVEHHTWRCFPGAKEVVVDQVLLPRTALSTDLPSLASSTVPRLVACIWTGDALGSPSGQSSNMVVAPSAEFNTTAAIALRELRDVLPGYMVPDIIVPISHVPLSTSGKTERSRLLQHLRAIPAADWHSFSRNQLSKRPVEGDAERKFHKILTSLLNIPPETVGADDSFYHLGGDSIFAMKIAASARTEGLAITSHDILRHPTISGWASVARDGNEGSAISRSYEPWSLITEKERQDVLAAHLQPYTAESIADIIPTVSFQSYYITNSSLVSMAEVFSSPLDMDRLYQACAKVMAHYSILRTLFVSTDTRILQVILEEVQPKFHFMECDDPETYIAERSKEKPAPTTKQGELPVSFTVVTSSTRSEWAFIVRLSHAQYDGSSLPFLWQAIATAYDGKELQPPTQFRDVVYNRLGDDHLEALSFWQGYLQKTFQEGTDPLQTTQILSSPSGSRSHIEPLTLRREVDHHPRLPDITVATLVKASIAYVLSRHAGLSEIILGQVVHGRGSPLPGMETVLGPCINLLPIRISLSQEHTITDLLRHVQAQQLATIPHDYISLDHIVNKCTTWPSNTTLGCIVHHQSAQPSSKIAIGGVESTSSVSWANSAQNPGQMSIISLERDSSLDLFMTFPTEGIAKSVAQKLADDLASAIRLFSNAPHYPLKMLTEDGVGIREGAVPSTPRAQLYALPN